MLDITLAGLGGVLLGAGLAFIYCRRHPTGDAAEVVRLNREMTEQYQRYQEHVAELYALLLASHQAIVVDRRKE
jgi:uncharacterized membrane protein